MFNNIKLLLVREKINNHEKFNKIYIATFYTTTQFCKDLRTCLLQIRREVYKSSAQIFRSFNDYFYKDT